jgi:transcription antitermination factor NusG
MDENKNWYGVYIRRGKEKEITETLTKRKIENYCPLNRVFQSAFTRDWAYEPLFPSCAFIKITKCEISQVKQINGVINFLFWLGEPAVVADAEIELIRKFVSEYTEVKLEKITVQRTPSLVTAADHQEISDYWFDVKNKKVKAFLPSLGYSLVAAVEKAEMEVLAPPIFPKWSSNRQKIASILSLGS